MERLDVDCFNNPFSVDTGTPKNIPLLDEVYKVETVYTCLVIHISSSDYCSTEVRNISDLTLNTVLSPACTFGGFTISSHNTSEKEGYIGGGRYNRTVRGHCNGSLPNGRIYLKRNL